ncbi:iron ABC transporter permease [Saccharibacillus sp. CPCC 101409]|uniref:FecCD family ABC transporter permease n=1 Tax=Saccharibacillus sp. CPCC 101409 TaxID=3058041 RepID=UPI0026719839|nr:iron ABC transporter permease [Saccharibacillus sp. CPCC 101409]MDO3411997.1 iron ABC transporter permease [Saccharibacillus sp. CPCC 101409]
MPSDSPRRLALVVAAVLLLIATVVYVSVTNGTFDMSVADVLKTLLRIDPRHEHDLVVFDFRLPRIVIALLVGFGLGIAGAVVQGITRNGLADPGLLGINAGAGTAIVLFMLVLKDRLDFTEGWLSFMMMPLLGMAGGLTAAALIFLFAQSRGRLDPQQLILVGIAVSSGFGAITLYLSLKMNPNDFEAAAVWLAGSLHGSNWRYIAAMLPWLLLLTPYVWFKSHVLDVMQLRDESTLGLGVELARQRKRLVLAAVGLVAACVSVSGSIGFVGLIAPHIARRLVGMHYRRMLPVAGLVGMAMVAAGDFIGRTLFAPAQLAAGVVISIIGVPYFVYLLFKTKM